MHSKNEVLAEALCLPPIERAELIDELFFSFDGDDRKVIDALWANEAEDRVEAYKRGEFSAIPAYEVFAGLSNSSSTPARHAAPKVRLSPRQSRLVS